MINLILMLAQDKQQDQVPRSPSSLKLTFLNTTYLHALKLCPTSLFFAWKVLVFQIITNQRHDKHTLRTLIMVFSSEQVSRSTSNRGRGGEGCSFSTLPLLSMEVFSSLWTSPVLFHCPSSQFVKPNWAKLIFLSLS